MPTYPYCEKIYSSQIAIADMVKRGDNPISGARVKIDRESSPESFQAILSMKAMKYGSQWENMSDRPDRKITASDGYFFFVNLPDGSYSLKVSEPGRKGEQEVVVPGINVTHVRVPANSPYYKAHDRIVTQFQQDIDLDSHG